MFSIANMNISTCKEVAKLRHHVFTVYQSVELLKVSRFHPDIKAHIRKM